MFLGTQTLLQRIMDLPAIVQGALGSALFWVITVAITFLLKRCQKVLPRISEYLRRQELVREYVFLRYSNMSGLINSVEGSIYEFKRALRYTLQALLFICVALLCGGFTRMLGGICLVAGVAYLVKALRWITPNEAWTHQRTPLEIWRRIAEIERICFGQPSPETTEAINKLETSSPDSENTAVAGGHPTTGL